MAGRYTYPCPGCGTRQEAQASGVFGEAPPHRPCAACEELDRQGSLFSKAVDARIEADTREGSKSKR